MNKKNTIKTENTIKELSQLLNNEKYILLKGGSAVGKTFLAKEISKEITKKEYNFFKNNSKRKNENSEFVIEIISLHPTYSYEDFIFGIKVNSESKNLKFEYKDKIFLELIKKAQISWNNKENKKYILILDDINRAPLSDILGEALLLLEPHGNKTYVIKIGLDTIEMPPNFFIVATKNTSIESRFHIDKALQRRFFEYTIESNLNYIYDEKELEAIKTTPFNVVELYNIIKDIVTSNINHRYKEQYDEVESFIIGHGFFKKNTYVKNILYRVIPLLKEYYINGILEENALIQIDRLIQHLNVDYTLNSYMVDNNRIQLKKKDINKDIFLNEETTHIPFINLISRIKEQGIISDIDIENHIIFNKNILYRVGEDSNKNFFGTLYASNYIKENLKLGKRALYKNDYISICNEKFYIAGEIQPTEYVKWDDRFINHTQLIVRKSTSPNLILFYIIKYYYKTYISNCERYLNKYASNTNISLLKNLAESELYDFIKNFKDIPIPKFKNKNEQSENNKKANTHVREIISELKILWSNINDKLYNENNDEITLKGVYKMSNKETYKEYIETMDSLGIKQMILQGPPGTSKTYSTRGLLKYVAKEIDDAKLNELQIINYDTEKYNKYLENNTTSIPPIAWDIVQFHPSYGYEDFIRGINIKTTNGNVDYYTVNKVLGNIAKLANASKERGEDTKFFLVIDEINRANLATVFGELIYGLEYRGEGVSTPYIIDNSNKVLLPNNLYIIGTMNTADKSIGGIDYAIRRRFLFFSLPPNKNIILNNGIINNEENFTADEKSKKSLNKKACNLFESISELFTEKYLNSEYFKEDVQIGHTYFIVNSEEELFMRFKYQIIPILIEYMKDGMFNLDVSSEDEYFNAFIKCIKGLIKISDNDTIKNIFNNLISNKDTVE